MNTQEKDINRAHRAAKMAFYGETSDKLKKFRQECLRGPVHVCVSCNRLLYRHMIVTLTDSMKNHIDSTLLEHCLPTHSSSDVNVCKTSKGYLLKNKMPPQRHANNLQLDNIPEELENLCELECQVIAKRIPFMKIVNLAQAAQKGIRGAVVNVPTDLSKICEMLPRKISDTGIIALKLKESYNIEAMLTIRLLGQHQYYICIFKEEQFTLFLYYSG